MPDMAMMYSGKGEEAKAVVLSWARLTGLHREGWNGHKNYFRCPTCKAGFMSFFLCLEHMVVYTNHFPMEKKITPEELYYKLLIKSKEAQEYNRQRQTNYLPTFDPERTVAHHLYVCPQRGCGVGSKTSEVSNIMICCFVEESCVDWTAFEPNRNF